MGLDYKKLGFRCGIEIHQQLEGKKLFCSCPAANTDEKPDLRVERNLRAVAGETGKIDRAALHEMKKAKRFVYVSSSSDTCLVEYDDEPPGPMNSDAVRAALEVCQLLGAKVVDEIQVMRKTVVDGSNTSGFQRTALVGMDGHIETEEGRVMIPTICLEEEASQKLREDNESIVYRLDRLGIALIELATDDSIRDPEHARETAEKLGMVLRSTGRVKRGIGTIRQDVNISIKGGARTEVKGFQDLKSIPQVIHSEVKRQLELIGKGKTLKPEVRKAEPDMSTSFLRPMPGSARMYPETDVLPIVPEAKAQRSVELLSDKSRRFERDYGLGRDLSRSLVKSLHADLFEQIMKGSKNLKPAFAAELLVSYKKELVRDYMPCRPELVTEDLLKRIFAAVDDGSLPKGMAMDALVSVAKGKGLKLEDYRLVGGKEITEKICQIIDEDPDAPFGAMMGILMQEFKGRIDGRQASDELKRQLKARKMA